MREAIDSIITDLEWTSTGERSLFRVDRNSTKGWSDSFLYKLISPGQYIKTEIL